MPKYYKLTVHYNKINQNTDGVTLLVDDDVPRSSFQSAPQTFTTWSGEKEYIPPQIPYTIKEMKLKPVAEVLDYVILRYDSPIMLAANEQEIKAQGEQILKVSAIEVDEEDNYVYTLIGYDVAPSIASEPDSTGMDIKVLEDYIQKK